MKRIFIIIGVIFFIFIIMHFGTIKINQPKSNIKCSSFIRMDLSLSSSQEIIIDTVFNIRRESGNFVLLINGTAKFDGRKTIISRVLTLKENLGDSGGGESYLIKKVLKGQTDTTPDNIFNDVISEVSGDSQHFYLNVKVHMKNAILIAGPYSDLLMCVED